MLWSVRFCSLVRRERATLPDPAASAPPALMLQSLGRKRQLANWHCVELPGVAVILSCFPWWCRWWCRSFRRQVLVKAGKDGAAAAEKTQMDAAKAKGIVPSWLSQKVRAQLA